MGYYEEDFSSKLKMLDDIIFKERYMNLCNSNDNFRTIAPYIYLFRQYYFSVKTLLKDTQNNCVIYPLARSACECFASIYHLINTFEDPNAFANTVKKEYQANIKQLWRIYNKTQDSNSKNILFTRIKGFLKEIGEITGSEDDSTIENKAKSYNELIGEKVENAFSNLPSYSSDVDSYKNLYLELCLYSHNNIESILNRFYDDSNGQIYFNLKKEDVNILPTKYMFVACADYIITWLNRKV